MAVSLVDRTHRGRLALTGEDAAAFLDGQLSNDIPALAPGTGCRAALLTPKGKMLADVRVLRTPDGREYWLECERIALQALFDALRRGIIGWRAELHKRTLEQTTLSLVGPEAGDPATPLHASVAGEVGGAPVLRVRTPEGEDVICATEDAQRVRAALGAPELGEDEADVLRVEAGVPLYGAELDDSVIPQEAALNETHVSFTKGCYVGQETVARLHWRGKPNRHLRGLRLSAPVEPGTPLVLGEREVGRVASSVVSPRLGPIALALVRREAGPGDELQAGGAIAVVSELPFERG
ncbi:MAG: CAF17-like 4Fe-4S cluster assembly/insertion protein YgfZ [Solirubrobacteraceae bacterium]